MNYIDHTCIHIFFFKILQSSSNKNNQHVLYFLNAGGSLISNMTLPCVIKVKRLSVHICIFLIPDTASLTSPSLRTPSVWCWRSGWLAGGRSVNGLFIQVDRIEIDANECEWISGRKEMKLGKFWCAKIRLTDCVRVFSHCNSLQWISSCTTPAVPTGRASGQLAPNSGRAGAYHGAGPKIIS